MLNRRRARTDPWGTPLLGRRNLLFLPFRVVRVKLQLATHLHDHVDPVAINAKLKSGYETTENSNKTSMVLHA